MPATTTLRVFSATDKDKDKIEFLSDSYNGAIPYNSERAKKYLDSMMKDGRVILGEFNGELIGGIAGVRQPCMFQEKNMFMVMFFTMLPSYKFMTKRFVEAVEEVLSYNCSMITFGVPSIHLDEHSDRLSKFFTLLGYKELETQFYKNLGEEDVKREDC